MIPELYLVSSKSQESRSQWPRILRRGSAAARVLRVRVRIPSEAWISVCSDCYMLSGWGFCYRLITCPDESYRVCCVWGGDYTRLLYILLTRVFSRQQKSHQGLMPNTRRNGTAGQAVSSVLVHHSTPQRWTK